MTQTPPSEGPDPDRHPDPDPGPDTAQTQTPDTVRTRTPDPDPDSVRVRSLSPDAGQDPDSGPGPQTRTPDQTPAAKIGTSGPGLDRAPDPGLRTRTSPDPDGEVPARWERFAAGWPQWVLTAVVAVMASVGQIQFAKANGATEMIWLPGGRDITPLFAPFVFDLSVAGLYAYGMFVAVRYKASPWLPWGAGTAIGAFSVYTNTLHRGALVFASASAVLIITWLVRLVIKYRHLPHVKAQRVRRAELRAGRRATAKPRLILSALVVASRQTAARSWVIARRRPIAAIAEQMNRDGNPITERDLVIRAAELWITVHSDRVVAELAAAGDPPSRADKAAYAAWCARRDQALRQAEIVAWDAIDEMLGLPVIKREGIKVNRLSYVEPQPLPAAAVPVITSAAARATAALPPSESRRKITAAPAAAEPVLDGPIVELLPGEPVGNARINWLPLDQIPGLPAIDPTIVCKCHTTDDPEKWCGKSLAEHVARRGKQILLIVQAVPDWDTRAGRIGKDMVKEICKAGGSGAQNEIAWVVDQLRLLAKEQNAVGGAAS